MNRGLLVALALVVLAGCSGRPGQQRFAREFDPDSVADAFARPSGALVPPGATRAFQVTETGDLYDGAWRVAFSPAADGAAAGAPARIAAFDRWRPVLHWTRRAGDVRFEFEAVAFSQPAPADTEIVASVVVRVRNTGAVPHTASLRVALAPPERDPVFVAWDAPDSMPLMRWAAPGTRDAACAWSDQPLTDGAPAIEVTLTPRASRTLRFLLPAYPAAAATLARLARVPHARRVDEVLAQCDARLAAGASFALGDAETESALRAATSLLLACRERHGPLWFPIGGPFQYRDVWLRDGARVAQALAIAGHTREASELAAGLATLQWPNGAYLTQRGQLDGTGQALWTFEQVLLRCTPRPPLDAFLDGGLHAWRWLEWERSPETRGGERFGAMMPFADPRDGELVRAQLTGNDAWSIAGERALAHLLQAAGRSAQAESVGASVAGYRVGFAAALARCGAAEVPPSWQRVGRDWGNLAVGWPCEALAPDDAHLAATARRAWHDAGDNGLVAYGTADSLHAYLGADLGTWALLAGRRDDAERVLAALLRWRTASGTSCELFSSAGDFGRNLPPHATSAAALVALVRNMVLYDDADTLRLTVGARPAWWRGANVARAPTWWGPLDVAFGRTGEEAWWRWTPVPVWTVLTLPPGTRLAAPPATPLRAGGRPDRVLAPPGTPEARVRVVADARGR
jgi:hypothetical protein